MAALLFLSGCFSEDEENIALTQKRLNAIYNALQIFQSESYFGHTPENLGQLHHYKTDIFFPGGNTLQEDEADNAFIKSNQFFSLIPDRRVFLRSGLDRDEEKELAENSEEILVDYELLPEYRMFLPDKTIIIWDKPGNFSTGGNLLFADGSTVFLNLPAEDYQRFTTALKTGTDRKFVRDICLKNSIDCSLSLLKENVK